MEGFLKGLGDRMNVEYTKVHQLLETDLKRLYHTSFTQVAACFEGPNSLQEASECGDRARAPIESYNNAMGEAMGILEKKFKSCLSKCGLNQSSQLSDELRNCLTSCTDGSIQELQESISKFQSIARGQR